MSKIFQRSRQLETAKADIPTRIQDLEKKVLSSNPFNTAISLLLSVVSCFSFFTIFIAKSSVGVLSANTASDTSAPVSSPGCNLGEHGDLTRSPCRLQRTVLSGPGLEAPWILNLSCKQRDSLTEHGPRTVARSQERRVHFGSSPALRFRHIPGLTPPAPEFIGADSVNAIPVPRADDSCAV